MAHKNKTKLSDAQYLELGKKLQAFYDMGYVSKRQAIWFSFIKGVAGGTGAFLGGTLVIAILIWILGLFHSINFLDKIVIQVQSTLQK